MATITKTLRIDEEFIGFIEEYCSLVKDLFGVAPSVNSILADSVVSGFGSRLGVFKVILSSELTDSASKEKFNDDFRKKCSSLIKRYENYEFMKEVASNE